MPKAKPLKKKRKTKKIKRSRPRLGLYLLAGLTTVLIMWALIREPMPAPQDLEKLVVQEITERTAKRETKKKQEKSELAVQEKAPTKVTRRTDTILDEATVAQPPEVKTPEVVKPKTGETELDLVVRGASEKLGVSQNNLRRRKQDNLVQYSIPINRSQMDLTYANMIFKGEMENAGAKLIKGMDTRSRQTLLFAREGITERYELELRHDSSVYKDSQVQKTITIVVDDFGAIGGKLLDGFFELDKEVVFAIFPEEANSISTMQRATAQGRDTIIHVPMEPIGYPRVNPGKNAILVQHKEDRIEKQLSGFINKMPDCIGINNHMGSLATTDPDVMQVVMNTLKTA
jgi:hypothetical protein